MCVVSMVGDHYDDKWDPFKRYPGQNPNERRPIQVDWPNLNGPTKQEFDELKKEVEELGKLLKRAKEYDEKNNEPNCEIEEKMEFLKKVAKLVDIDLDEYLK